MSSFNAARLIYLSRNANWLSLLVWRGEGGLAACRFTFAKASSSLARANRLKEKARNFYLLFIMDFNLLKKLLPAECIEFTTRKGVRAADGRKPREHRDYSIQRSVLASAIASCTVKLGAT